MDADDRDALKVVAIVVDIIKAGAFLLSIL